jgi:hypothetical protein
MVMSHPENAGQNNNLIATKFFGNMSQLKYFGTITNQNCIHKEIRRD